MYKNTNCFHLAIPCGDLEVAKKFYSETLGCRLDNSAQEWADVDFWGNELTLHKSEHKLDNERHDVDMGNVSVPHFGVHITYIYMSNLEKHFKPKNFSDKIAFSFTKFLRFLADTFLKKDAATEL